MSLEDLQLARDEASAREGEESLKARLFTKFLLHPRKIDPAAERLSNIDLRNESHLETYLGAMKEDAEKLKAESHFREHEQIDIFYKEGAELLRQ
jgi:hypothetical protein